MNQVLLIIGPGDHTGTHMVSCKLFAQCFQNRGFHTEILKIATREDVKSLAKKLASGEVALVHVEQGQLLDIKIDGMNLYDRFNVVTCSQIRDHWFYPWLKPGLFAPPTKSIFIHCDSTIEPVMSSLRGSHSIGQSTIQSVSALTNTQHAPNPCDNVPVFVGTCLSPIQIRDSFASTFPKLASIADSVIEELKGRVSIPDSFWQIQMAPGTEDHVLYGNISIPIEAYYQLFLLQRASLRTNFLNFLCGFNCRLYVKGNWGPTSTSRAKVTLGGLSKEASQRLVANSSLVLSDQSGLFNAVGERVATAIFSGQTVAMRHCEWLKKFKTSIPLLKSYCSYDSLGDLLETSSRPGSSEDQITPHLIPAEILPSAYVDQVLREYENYVAS